MEKRISKNSYFMFGVVVLALLILALLDNSSARGNYVFQSFGSDISAGSVGFSSLNVKAGNTVTIFGNARNSGSSVIEM